MIYFKGCPRCRGDMYLTSDQYGRYVECLQCGYEVDAQDGLLGLNLSVPYQEEVTAKAA